MRMIIRTTTAAALMLAGCSQPAAENGAAATNVTGATPAPADEGAGNTIVLPNLTEAAPAVATTACPDTAGTMCIGSLIVRAEGLTLSADGGPRDAGARYLKARGSLVFENRTTSPIRLAVLDAPIDALFDNGIRLTIARNGLTGIFLCGRSGPDCFQGSPGEFQTLAPGDSPARANVTLEGRMDGSLAASLPTVKSATITVQVYVVDAANAGSTLNISLPNAAVRNQLAQ